MPIIHGSIQQVVFFFSDELTPDFLFYYFDKNVFFLSNFFQRRFSILGRTLDMILIARRSRHYAGTRYLKRGVSVHGKVANDCEIEHVEI